MPPSHVIGNVSEFVCSHPPLTPTTDITRLLESVALGRRKGPRSRPTGWQHSPHAHGKAQACVRSSRCVGGIRPRNQATHSHSHFQPTVATMSSSRTLQRSSPPATKLNRWSTAPTRLTLVVSRKSASSACLRTNQTKSFARLLEACCQTTPRANSS